MEELMHALGGKIDRRKDKGMDERDGWIGEMMIGWRDGRRKKGKIDRKRRKEGRDKERKERKGMDLDK